MNRWLIMAIAVLAQAVSALAQLYARWQFRRLADADDPDRLVEPNDLSGWSDRASLLRRPGRPPPDYPGRFDADQELFDQ